ncbi:MAG TPA: sigma-70 family RNA polymerase sigma factor [Pyrinomonadaceae bacterium]|nr:sigma-70 family RNA polymerase sigma factor [Pyrinomonadaceae bacterium]
MKQQRMSQRLAMDLVVDLAGLERRPASHSGSLMNSSEDLIRRSRAGDQEAFRLIFERYARPVLSFIYDLVGQRDLADELTQETFVRAYKSLNSVRDDTKLASWLFGIGRNVAREAIRARYRENQNVSKIDFADEQLESRTPVSPAQDLLHKELNSAMQNALALLDEDHRVVFVLKVFRQCSYREIVDVTGFTLAKVKTDLHRARLEVRRRLGPFLETER